MLFEFKHLQRQFGGKHIWARGYFAVSSGNVTDEVIMKYIENQDLESEDDNFQINQELYPPLGGIKFTGFSRLVI